MHLEMFLSLLTLSSVRILRQASFSRMQGKKGIPHRLQYCSFTAALASKAGLTGQQFNRFVWTLPVKRQNTVHQVHSSTNLAAQHGYHAVLRSQMHPTVSTDKCMCPTIVGKGNRGDTSVFRANSIILGNVFHVNLGP